MLALAALPGTALGRLGEPSAASPAAWAAPAAAARMLHGAPLPPWPGRSLNEIASHLDGEEEHLRDVVGGYGTGVDLDVIRLGWSLRSLLAARWPIEHGFDPSSPGCEFDVLRSQL